MVPGVLNPSGSGVRPLLEDGRYYLTPPSCPFSSVEGVKVFVLLLGTGPVTRRGHSSVSLLGLSVCSDNNNGPLVYVGSWSTEPTNQRPSRIHYFEKVL